MTADNGLGILLTGLLTPGSWLVERVEMSAAERIMWA